MDRGQLASPVLRVGVAFAFIYAAIDGFVDPDSWVGWFPKSARDIVPAETLLRLWGIFQIILSLWIVSGKKIFWPSLVASLSLAGLILTNLGAMDIIFRDVTILAATIALTIQSFSENSVSTS
ncbi:MAG: hypothetical protein UX89_C0012G0023 [Parcubacteria group bacterium GW2011_GWA2_47_16]|nr:MAG: hypothetical protein UX89_C0012G0023 [Parcubacteria group bacterium GW2011_GWA2_47_16]